MAGRSGNVVSVTNEAREEVAHYEYDAWGNLLTSCGSLANEFNFLSQQASAGTGLIDFGYRWYDPSIGRWTQRDPIGIAGGVNLYGYVGQDPANCVDSFGLAFDPMLDNGSVPGRAGGSMSWDGSYNEVGGTINVINAGVNGFFDEVANDPVLQGIHGGTQVAFGVVLCYAGVWPIGAPMVAMGLSNIADSISQATGHGPFNPVADAGRALLEALGMSPEDAAIGWAYIELNLDLAGGTCAVAWLRGAPGGGGRSGAQGSVPREGIYEFSDAQSGGKPYVGQSGNIPQRLKQHRGSGSLLPGSRVQATKVQGGKVVREIAEQKRIQQLTGGVPARHSPNVANRRDPVGPNRRHLLGE